MNETTEETITDKETTKIFELNTAKIAKYLSSLTPDERKENRSEYYQYSESDLDFELYEKLKDIRLLYLDTKAPLNKNGKFQGALKWDLEGLNALNSYKNLNVLALKYILIHEKNITYEKVEALFNNDPNFLLAFTALLTSNFNNAHLAYYDRESYRKQIVDRGFDYQKDFQFTKAEETVFFTTRTLLMELIENTPEEKRDYLNEMRRNLDTVIYKFNTGLIFSIANKYAFRRSIFDNFQDGYLGYLTALNKFDIDMRNSNGTHNKFSTYAVWWIRQAITRQLAYKSESVRLTVKANEEILKFLKVRSLLTKELGRKPDTEEVLEFLGENSDNISMDKELVEQTLNLMRPLSLDYKYNRDSDEMPFYDFVPDGNNSFEKTIEESGKQTLINEIIGRTDLSDRELGILEMRFIDGLTLDAIGKKEGVTRERIRQIIAKTLKKLKRTGSDINISDYI
jgi:RNA polymerase primary sigma factor